MTHRPAHSTYQPGRREIEGPQKQDSGVQFLYFQRVMLPCGNTAPLWLSGQTDG